MTEEAMVLRQPARATTHPLTLEARDPRPLEAGEVLLRVSACGLCRTDLQICEGDLVARKLPVVPGHQIVGRVAGLGAGVAGLREGDRVGVGWLASACGACDLCHAGSENLCRSARFTGWDGDGGYATEVIVRADATFPIPDVFADVEAAPLLCAGVIGYRALKRCKILPGQKLGLFGFGSSASLAIQIARHWGCRVFVFTRSEAERARATELGAEWAGGYASPTPELLDAAITFAPAGDVVVAALERCDRGATVAINAIHLDQMPAFSYDKLWWERSLVSVANYTRADAREFLALAADIRIATTVECYDLADANVALERVSSGKLGGTAVLRM